MKTGSTGSASSASRSRVFVAGTGMTKFGELWGEGVETLARAAALEAVEEANLRLADIDLLIVGNMLLSSLEERAQVGAVVADALGFWGPTVHVEAACASGGLAVLQAVAALGSGRVSRVLVVGVEKMTDAGSDQITRALMAAGAEEEQWAGATFPSLYALMMQAYMRTHKTTLEDMAAVAVANHAHGLLNPLAQFHKKISVAEVLDSELVADPMRQLMCAPISDGAAAVVLESGGARQKLGKHGVEIVGSGQGGDSLGLSGRENITLMRASQEAGRRAFAEAGVAAAEIDVAEVHDCFAVAQLMAVRDLGLPARTVINTSGGLKACGHPVGATGVKQVVEIARQLAEKCGKRQVRRAAWGLTQNVGGTGATAVVHILRRDDAD